jgi:hypothetical protein
MKILSCIALGIWVFQLFYGIYQIASDKPINSIVYLCAVVSCILYFGEKIKEDI